MQVTSSEEYFLSPGRRITDSAFEAFAKQKNTALMIRKRIWRLFGKLFDAEYERYMQNFDIIYALEKNRNEHLDVEEELKELDTEHVMIQKASEELNREMNGWLMNMEWNYKESLRLCKAIASRKRRLDEEEEKTKEKEKKKKEEENEVNETGTYVVYGKDADREDLEHNFHMTKLRGKLLSRENRILKTLLQKKKKKLYKIKREKREPSPDEQQAAAHKLFTEHEHLKNEFQFIQNELARAERNGKELRSSLTSLEEKVSRDRVQLNSLSKEFTELAKYNDSLNTVINGMEAENSKMREESKKNEQREKVLRKEILVQVKEDQDIRTDLRRMSQRLNNIEKENTDLKKKVTILEISQKKHASEMKRNFSPRRKHQ